MKKNKKKISLGKYFAKYKFAIALYVLCYIIAGACSVITTVFFANAVEKITSGLYNQAIMVGLIIIGLIALKRLCWYLSGIIYNTYSVKIMSNINADLAKQAFKLNSKTYSNHDTGTFVQRIVTDPERVIERFADMVDIITEILTATIMLVYISTLHYIVAICLWPNNRNIPS